MPEASRYLSSYAIEVLRREIADAGGVEIFAVLSRAEGEELFSEVAVACRGNYSAVPALMSRVDSGDMVLHNHPSGVLQPSLADMNVATLFGEEGVGSMIVDNEVTRCQVIVEPATTPKPVAVEAQLVRNIFEPGGVLAGKLPQYESRESQLAMALDVTRAINEGRILAVEAGTGTGKSLAYLLPALLWTKHNRGRVVIATKTIALQEQLVFKDIPLARDTVPDAPKAALVKGRNNYVCLRKLNDLRTFQMALFEDEERTVKEEIEDLGAWVADSGSGDRADLPFMPSKDAWDMVRSDADMCLGSKCPYFQQSPFYESRRQAAQARILVVNQALLFSDLALRSASGNYQAAAVIPPYQHVILDEAHSIEDIATDHFGQKLSSFGLRLTMGRFLAASRGNKGLLHRLFQASVDLAPALMAPLEREWIPEFRRLQEEVTGQLYALSSSLHNSLNRDQQKQCVVWLKQSLLGSQTLDEARAEAKTLLALLHELVLVVRKIRTLAKDESDAFQEKMSGLFIELDARLSRLENNLGALKNFAVDPGENQVPWLELKKMRSFDEFEYCISPLNVAGMLREALLKPFKSVVLTSATLDLGDKFDFLASRNGLKDWEEKDWDFRSYPSPFDFRTQARLLIPRLPSSPNHATFVRDLVALILETVFSGYRGGTLVLFTSYQLLYRVASDLEYHLARAGIDLLVQGRASRGYLVERLKKTQGVLLGTDSFWEGIDLPGDALTKVIITKLPFRQMGDPIFEARCTALDNAGRSSFNEYSLPLALLKFKQGIGRLIRHKQDRGVLVIADNRIRSKGYGRRFLALADAYPVWDVDPGQMGRALVGTTETV